MVADEDGNIHMVWIGRADGNGRLYYARRSAAGVWEGPDVVSQGAIWWDRPALAIDNEGTLHLVWSYNWNEITYLQKPRGGDWSAPKSLGVGEQPSLAVDSAGRVHLIYFGMPASITYLNLDTEGNWSEERILGDSIGRSALVVGPDDTVHVLFMRVSETGQLEICHTMCRPGSKWTEPRAVCSNPSTSSESITMALGPDGKLHAFWIESGTGYYATRDLAGQWSKKQRIQQDLGSADMVVDGAGVVHLVCATNGGGALTYRWGSGDGVWSDPVSVRDHGKAASGRRPDLCLDRDNRLHLAWHSEIPIDGSTLRYTAMRCAAQTGTASLAQSVTIPADMHRPTLAFSYALRFAGAQAQHPLTIEVSDGVSTTQVSPEGGYVPMQWADAWIDMAPWAGQTVTVTFSLQQRADEPLARLALDDISLGSWLTPVITKVTPATVQDWTAGDTLLKIEGENLLPGAVVSLGERQLDTTWVDEHTLQASLPADLLPGIHPVRVTNPAGQSVEMAGVALGSQLELPAIYKWH
ncbi:MAG: hypothetical protein GX552_10710, partial [Chloroflexi bacterium]|nr:hypothetical protein [Chloroflexota bacterium]